MSKKNKKISIKAMAFGELYKAYNKDFDYNKVENLGEPPEFMLQYIPIWMSIQGKQKLAEIIHSLKP